MASIPPPIPPNPRYISINRGLRSIETIGRSATDIFNDIDNMKIAVKENIKEPPRDTCEVCKEETYLSSVDYDNEEFFVCISCKKALEYIEKS